MILSILMVLSLRIGFVRFFYLVREKTQTDENTYEGTVGWVEVRNPPF